MKLPKLNEMLEKRKIVVKGPVVNVIGDSSIDSIYSNIQPLPIKEYMQVNTNKRLLKI